MSLETSLFKRLNVEVGPFGAPENYNVESFFSRKNPFVFGVAKFEFNTLAKQPAGCTSQ